MPRDFLLVYFTTTFSGTQKVSLISALNQPNKQFGPEDVVEEADVEASQIQGKSTEEIAVTHKSIAPEKGWDVDRVAYGGLVVVADARTLAETGADGGTSTVDLIYFAPESTKTLRASVSAAVGVWTSLDAGTCDWETFERESGENNILRGPGNESGETSEKKPSSVGDRVKMRARKAGSPARRQE